MTQGNPTKFGIRLPAQGLLMQLITMVLLPLTLILLAITFGSITIHQNAMRSMVGERDLRSVSTAARALSAQIDLRVKELQALAVIRSRPGILPGDGNEPDSSFLVDDFNRGLATIDGADKLVPQPGISEFWRNLAADTNLWQATLAGLKSQPGKLLVVSLPADQTHVGVISTPSGEGQFLLGAFSINTLAEKTLLNILSPGSDLSILLVDGNGQVLYQAGNTADHSGDHAGVAEALQGKSGTVYVKYRGDEHVTAYSPVASAGWALITEESWEALSTPTLRTSQVAPLVLVPALLIMLLALWLGTRQIIQPLRTLEAKSASLASGDFTAIEAPVHGIAEIQYLQKELVEMAHKVQEAQRSLHGYIGSITAAQEEERHRLARELHDDTLQALIALKQRVQLAQLELQAVSGPPVEFSELDEIATLTEQTIENLRRLTRALRPIYLEDLGLVPALEMLARETGQGTGITIEFQRLGVERRLDANVELALYRMAQEALSNIARHAKASRASLTISFSPGLVSLKVADNGIGFQLPENPAEYAAHSHYGLLGLHERAELINAAMDIHTAPGKGTRLTVTLRD